MPAARKVALIIETSKSFGRGLLLGIGRYANLHDGWTLFVEERGLSDRIPSWLKPTACDGIILRGSERSLMSKVLAKGIPTVCVGEENPKNAFAVVSDEAEAAGLAAEHLLERGFRHFAFVGLRDYAWSDVRRDAFVQRLESDGIQCHVFEPGQKTRRPPRWDSIRRRLHQWLQPLPKPVGIMCCYDVMARELLDVCHELSIPVPEELAVIGVDNDRVLCSVSQPSLTSVELDTLQIGFEAATMLDKLMLGQPADSPVVVSPRGIVTRGSTDSLAIDDPDIAKALAFIRLYACDGIDASDIVAQVPLSRRTLERRFREQVGSSLLEELNRVRLRRVKQFLVETDLKLDAIAIRCGFAHTPYMATQFSKHFGITPGKYRSQQ